MNIFDNVYPNKVVYPQSSVDLGNRITALENADLSDRLDTLEDADLDTRVTALSTSVTQVKMVQLSNKTGVASVKGSVVSASTAVDNAFMLQTNEFDTIGIVAESGIADGSLCWIITSGIAEVLLKDNTAATRGNWVIAADTDGRADATQPTPFPNNTLNEHTQHFKEIGHCTESKIAGTNVLAKCIVHCN